MPGRRRVRKCFKALGKMTVMEFSPIIMVTARDPIQEAIKGLEAGAETFFITKPHQPELLARVKSCCVFQVVCTRYAQQSKELTGEMFVWRPPSCKGTDTHWTDFSHSAILFVRRSLPALIVDGGADDPSEKSYRREVTVILLTFVVVLSFADSSEPEEVMGVLPRVPCGDGKDHCRL